MDHSDLTEPCELCGRRDGKHRDSCPLFRIEHEHPSTEMHEDCEQCMEDIEVEDPNHDKDTHRGR